jgi:hypothetical protein
LWRWRSKRRRKQEHAAEERAAAQERCSSLVGDAVMSVAYVEGEYDEPLWNLDDDYDSVDHGVELTLRSGRTVALQWDHATVDFGVTLIEGAVGVIEGTPRLDVSATSRWSTLLGRKITGCRLIWKPIEGGAEIPQTIRLDFEGERRVLMTASEFDGVGDWGADHVTVFFDDAWERRSDLTRGIHETLD